MGFEVVFLVFSFTIFSFYSGGNRSSPKDTFLLYYFIFPSLSLFITFSFFPFCLPLLKLTIISLFCPFSLLRFFLLSKSVLCHSKKTGMWREEDAAHHSHSAVGEERDRAAALHDQGELPAVVEGESDSCERRCQEL